MKSLTLLSVSLVFMSFSIAGNASECRLDEPVDIGVSDPRGPLNYNERFTLANAKLEPAPEFKEKWLAYNPPASENLSVEFFKMEGICSGNGLGISLGYSSDCARGHDQGSWKREYCTVNAVDFGQVGFSHVYRVFNETCETNVTEENGIKTFHTKVKFSGEPVEEAMAKMKGTKLLALELTTHGSTYCVRGGTFAKQKGFTP